MSDMIAAAVKTIIRPWWNGPEISVGKNSLPVSTLFASFLGYNPIGRLLRPAGVTLPKHDLAVLTSKEYFPHLISGPFHHGLVIVFGVAIAMSLAGAVISLLRGGQFYYDGHEAVAAGQPDPAAAAL